MATDKEVKKSTSNDKTTNSWLSSTPSTNKASTIEGPAESGIKENPWLAASYTKSSKNKAPDSHIEKIQKKRKRNDLDNADSRVNIDVSVEAINEKLNALSEAAEDEDAPTMTYGRGKIAFQQTELVNRAFAADGFEEEFMAEKAAAIAEDAPKEEDLTLPGWGSWTGQGVKRRATEKKLIKKIPGIEESKRKDAKLKHVIINEKTVKKVTFISIKS